MQNRLPSYNDRGLQSDPYLGEKRFRVHKYSLEKSRECTGNLNLNRKDRPSGLPLQTPGARLYIPSLLLWVELADAQACNHVLQTH